MAKQKKTKAQMMQDACAMYGQFKLIPIDGVEPLEVYAKVLSTKEFRDNVARNDGFRDRYDDGYNDDRWLALHLFDADGAQLFDPENMEDVLFLANLPAAVRMHLNQACNLEGVGLVLKKLMTSGSVL